MAHDQAHKHVKAGDRSTLLVMIQGGCLQLTQML